MSDLRQLAEQILSGINRELSDAESELQDATRKVDTLRKKRDAALVLVDGVDGDVVSTHSTRPNGKASAREIVYVSRPKTGDLFLAYLRQHSYGATPMQIYKDLKAKGAPIGKSTYAYHVLNRLEEKGLVKRSIDGKYTATADADASPDGGLSKELTQ